jgi:hypothetical protein
MVKNKFVRNLEESTEFAESKEVSSFLAGHMKAKGISEGPQKTRSLHEIYYKAHNICV